MAWQLTRESHVGIGTLADFAAAGVLVNEQASRSLRAISGSEPGIGTGQVMGRVAQAAGAWRLVHLHTRQLRTTAPAMLGFRGDVFAIRDLHKRVEATADRKQPLAHARDLESVLLGGVRAFADVACWNAEVLESLAHNGRLYMPGRLLRGDEVTNNPVLVQAKLADRMTLVTEECIQLLRADYLAACGASYTLLPSWPSFSRNGSQEMRRPKSRPLSPRGSAETPRALPALSEG